MKRIVILCALIGLVAFVTGCSSIKDQVIKRGPDLINKLIDEDRISDRNADDLKKILEKWDNEHSQ